MIMNVGVIGTPNRDKLILTSGAKVTAWGGIVYNILTMAHYLRPGDAVLPICPVGADARDDFQSLLEKFPNVDPSGIYQAAQRQNRVILKCITHDEKEETAELSLPPLPFDHISKHLSNLSFLLINFTSGRDLEKETLRRVRDEYKGPILLDVHSLTLSEPDSRGKRRLRALRDWQEWLEGMDYVQFTWNEAASLTGETNTTFAGLVEVADWLLERGTKGVIVTRGSEGAYYFHVDEQGILKEEVPPFKLHTVVDTTGCGDVFSAAFICNLLKDNDPLGAVQFAVKAAALKATFSGIGPWLSG